MARSKKPRFLASSNCHPTPHPPPPTPTSPILCSAVARGKKPRFLVSSNCHPQTIAVCQTRADGMGLQVEVVDEGSLEFGKDVCGVLLQYPATDGSIHDYSVGGGGAGGWVGGGCVQWG